MRLIPTPTVNIMPLPVWLQMTLLHESFSCKSFGPCLEKCKYMVDKKLHDCIKACINYAFSLSLACPPCSPLHDWLGDDDIPAAKLRLLHQHGHALHIQSFIPEVHLSVQPLSKGTEQQLVVCVLSSEAPDDALVHTNSPPHYIQILKHGTALVMGDLLASNIWAYDTCACPYTEFRHMQVSICGLSKPA